MQAKYIGSDLSRREYWTLELSRIHESHRLEEASLQNKRWFDYRRMTPGEATYYFAECYSQAYLHFYKQTKDLDSASDILPFSPDDIFQSNELTAMWLARQAADSIGCKYNFYLHHVFEVFTSRGWKNLPRPNQLYGEEMVMSVDGAWKKRQRDILQLADNEFFLEKSYVSHPDQIAYHDYLINQVATREHRHYALSAVMVTKKALPYELALREFGIDVCKRALMI